MRILINDRICSGARGLINFIEGLLGAPYHDDNWDGFRDCLLDLSWCQDPIEIMHESLPALTPEEFDTYVGILYEAERAWRLSEEIDFSVVFLADRQQEVRDIIQASNLALFNGMKGNALRLIQLGYGRDNRLIKVYLAFGTFCFSLDESLNVDYYSLSRYQISELLDGRLSIPQIDDKRINNVQTLGQEVSGWLFKSCNLFCDNCSQRHCNIWFRSIGIFPVVIDVYKDNCQQLRCFVNGNEALWSK